MQSFGMNKICLTPCSSILEYTMAYRGNSNTRGKVVRFGWLVGMDVRIGYAKFRDEQNMFDPLFVHFRVYSGI